MNNKRSVASYFLSFKLTQAPSVNLVPIWHWPSLVAKNSGVTRLSDVEFSIAISCRWLVLFQVYNSQAVQRCFTHVVATAISEFIHRKSIIVPILVNNGIHILSLPHRLLALESKPGSYISRNIWQSLYPARIENIRAHLNQPKQASQKPHESWSTERAYGADAPWQCMSSRESTSTDNSKLPSLRVLAKGLPITRL